MRLRHIPGAEEKVLEHPYVVEDPKSKKGLWKDVFGNNNPIRIEIGMGKGQFITELAARNPDINYIGIEMYSTVMLKALSKRAERTAAEGHELPNLYYICTDARLLAEVFEVGEVDRIYLNFSDPWPKDRHAGRRLTSPQFLFVYDKFLKKDGIIEFKTDNMILFDYSLEAIPGAGWNIKAWTKDLHNNAEMNVGNIMTEYEEKFSAKGNPICKLIADR